ncbi:MAG: molybdopterin-dependent oxidoreductase [Chthoniobacteraceae bacterium]
MSTETAAPPQMLNVQIDGVWMQFPKGTRVIEACTQAGKFIPRYCYHPKLSSPGNCRMCLVEMGMPKMGPDRKPVIGADGKAEIGWIPRPQISCAQDVAEGMGIRTDSQMVQECRKGVMEFLLINHPLDCPICDQAGECRLQEFSVEYGNAQSRFLERKVKKPKNVELGPRVTLDAERCVLCSRCIRFMKEVANDDVLGFVDRGSFSTIACHPDKTLDSNYSLNTVDICPVGALTSSDFRFKMRLWFLKETKTIDVNDGLGANIIIGARENQIYRITPRENNDVNGVWIPDSHRLNFKYLNREDRLKAPMVAGQMADWPQALAVAGEKLKKHRGEEVAIIASARMTNEELFLAKRLATALGVTKFDVLPRIGEPDGIMIVADRNPNTTGARLIGITGKDSGARLKEIAASVRKGAIKALICLGEDATKCGLTEEDLRKLETLIVTDILPNKTTPLASVLLPASGWAEKRGSMINVKGRLQRLNRAVEPPPNAHDDWEILRDLIQAVNGSNGLYMIEDVFKQMSAEVEKFAGLSLSKIGDLGLQVLESKSQKAE